MEFDRGAPHGSGPRPRPLAGLPRACSRVCLPLPHRKAWTDIGPATTGPKPYRTCQGFPASCVGDCRPSFPEATRRFPRARPEIVEKKLDADFRPYPILGASNPPLTHRALTPESSIGLLLPCNVVAHAADNEGTGVVAAMDAEAVLGLTDNEEVREVASEVRARLERAQRRVAVGGVGRGAARVLGLAVGRRSDGRGRGAPDRTPATTQWRFHPGPTSQLPFPRPTPPP
jgi:hypothetical protein